MSEPGPTLNPEAARRGAPQSAAAPAPEFATLIEGPPPGLLRRFFTTHRHIAGMLAGALVDHVRTLQAEGRGTGPVFGAQRVLAALFRPFLDRSLRNEPFPVQFRRRLEILGPTYIKLGQILSLRQDVLPRAVTEELKNLLDRLPAVPFERFKTLVAEQLGRPVESMFAEIESRPLGSASIAQIHRATTVEGDAVVIKLVKPNIRETLRRDAVLLRLFGRFVQIFLSRFQPRRIIDEFVEYTLREVDLRREADNAETFAANFKDTPDIEFPKIYPRYSGDSVLTMEFLDGIKPSDPSAQSLTGSERDRLIDLGAAAIIRMLYQDGFFHADLHPANLLILTGTRCGFIDLGMVGRFDDELRRTLLYYYYCLVMGDSENAARFLTAIAEPGPGADPAGFRREVEDISRRWSKTATFEDFSLGELILRSLGKAGQYRVYFPVELVLMVKALVTFEGVGQILRPGFDVVAVSQTHIGRIFMRQFSPLRIAREALRGAPEVVDALVKAPLLITEGLRFLEKTTRQPPPNPLAGIRGTMIAGASLVAGAILVAFGGPWPLWLAFFALAVVLALRRGEG